MSDNELIKQLGPLAGLIGTWEGDKGDDIAPADDRGIENNKYRERMIFENAGLVQNHEQSLYVLRYSTKAWRIGEVDGFHEEIGYWSWEPSKKEILKCFLVPRGIALIASGTAEVGSKVLKLRAEAGSSTNGICTNAFLDKEFKMEYFEITFTRVDQDTISYEQDTVMRMPNRSELFHHRDKNTLRRVRT